MKNKVRIPGILGGILFAVGIVGTFTIPGGGNTTDAEFLAFYNSSGKRTIAVFGFLVLIIACWLLVWLFNELRVSMALGMRTIMAHQFGVIGVVMVLVGGGIAVGPTMVQMAAGRTYVGPDIANTFSQASSSVLIAGIWTMAVSIFLTSLQMRSSGFFPRWLGSFGMVLAVLLAASIIGIPILLVPIWAIVVGITGAPQRIET